MTNTNTTTDNKKSWASSVTGSDMVKFGLFAAVLAPFTGGASLVYAAGQAAVCHAVAASEKNQEAN